MYFSEIVIGKKRWKQDQIKLKEDLNQLEAFQN